MTGCHLCVGSTPATGNVMTCPNMTLAVEQDIKPQHMTGSECILLVSESLIQTND